MLLFKGRGGYYLFSNVVSMSYCRKVSIIITVTPLSCNVDESPFGTPEACFLKMALLMKENHSSPKEVV